MLQIFVGFRWFWFYSDGFEASGFLYFAICGFFGFWLFCYLLVFSDGLMVVFDTCWFLVMA